MKYLIDSDWVVDYLAGKQQAISLLASVWQDGLAISLITLGEIYEGIYYGHDPQSSEAVFRQFLRSVDILSLNRKTARALGRGNYDRHGGGFTGVERIQFTKNSAVDLLASSMSRRCRSKIDVRR